MFKLVNNKSILLSIIIEGNFCGDLMQECRHDLALIFVRNYQFLTLRALHSLNLSDMILVLGLLLDKLRFLICKLLGELYCISGLAFQFLFKFGDFLTKLSLLFFECFSQLLSLKLQIGLHEIRVEFFCNRICGRALPYNRITVHLSSITD